LVLAFVLGVMGCAEASGTGGTGGRGQIPSEEAATPEECEYLGGGGDDTIACDYLTVDFSAALPTNGLEVEATSSAGDTFTPERLDEWMDPLPDEPALFLTLNELETLVLGFTITRIAKQPHYSPEELAVFVKVDNAVLADETLEPSYTCVELTGDDWCWQGAAMTLDVSP
jgi:hypothetical protein